MKDFNIAIIGCGTIGGGTARVLLELKDELSKRTGYNIVLKKIVDVFPGQSAKRHGIPLELFCGKGVDLKQEEANQYINEIINADEIDLVVEAIGGTSDYVVNLVKNILNAKKHLVTANKALLSKYGQSLFELAEKNKKIIGFETSVCTSIPIIKGIKECFTGDEIISLSGIMNGTSNYILSKMQSDQITFEEALKLAQKNGYAEADPTLDINGGDAGHKLSILIKLAFGLDVKFDELSIQGIQNITKEDLFFADEMDCTIKLICFAQKKDDIIYTTIRPMMVKNHNLLSQIKGTTNAVKVINRFSDENILIGKGAGSLEGGSAMTSDIVFIARYAEKMTNLSIAKNYTIKNLDDFPFTYNIIFDTEDVPGITGIVTTAIGNQGINIDTVGHNQHDKATAIFSIATMPCTLSQINKAIDEIKKKRSDVLITEPKIIPILH